MSDIDQPEGEGPPEGRGEGGRFTPGNRFGQGRPKGARNRLSEAFIADLEEVWKAHGPTVLRTLATEKPGMLARVVAGLEPKRVEVKEAALDSYTDEELTDALDALRAAEGADSED